MGMISLSKLLFLPWEWLFLSDFRYSDVADYYCTAYHFFNSEECAFFVFVKLTTHDH